MSDWFLTRQLIALGLTANATRPVPGGPASFPAFVAGWLSAELAPQLLTVTALDAVGHVARQGLGTRRDRLGLTAAAISSVGCTALIRAGNRAGAEVEYALREALAADYGEHLGRTPEPGDLATSWRQLAAPFWMRNVDVVTDRRLPYAPGGRRFEMDIYRRRDLPTGRPVLLQVHGGGWMTGSKQQQGIPLMLQMAARGWVCVAVNYPLSPRARWPEHLIAVKRAMAWIRAHGAEYGADPSFVAVTGGSAGGHLAAMLALTPDDKSLQPGFEDVDTSVQACVPHYGVYDLTAESGSRASRDMLANLTSRFVMNRQASYPEDYRAASPLSRVSAEAPPFFVIHGSHDTLVPTPEARRFVERLRAVSDNPVAYAEIGGAQHAFDLFPSIRSMHVVRGVERFLDWTLARAATHAAAPQLGLDTSSSVRRRQGTR